jgi:hypothetical protein
MDKREITSIQNDSTEAASRPKQGDKPRIGTLRMLMRLALGSAIIGREELKKRFAENQSNSHISAVELNEVTPIESDADRARFAVVGAVASSSEALKAGISKIGKRSDRTYSRLSRAIQPMTDSWLVKPFRRRYQHYLDHGDKLVSSWIATGRREEYLGRQLAQETAIQSIEETLDYLADSPELDELMTVQSGDLVDELLFDDIRESASNTSIIFSNWFNSTILRKKSQLAAENSKISPDQNDGEQ